MQLTPTQRILLAELVEHARTGYADGGWYIRRTSQAGRTAAVLARHGLAEVDERDMSGRGRDHVVATDAGKAWIEAHPSCS